MVLNQSLDRLGWLTGLRRIGGGLVAGSLLGSPGLVQASPVLSFDLPGVAVQAEAQSKLPPLLSFDLPHRRLLPVRSDALAVEPLSIPWESGLPPAFQSLFAGGSDSLVARAVGSAEGTRTAQGEFTWAYHGHRDPGNGKWNLGSFSYQHGADSPAQADQRQLQRLERQTQVLHQLAHQRGLALSLTEMINGIDLANQAPLAALDRGYVDWLTEARQLELGEAEGILYARTWSYWDPDLEAWNAPGLGNRWLSISEDQQRRQRAISGVLEQVAEP